MTELENKTLNSTILEFFPIGIIIQFNINFNPNEEIKNTKWERIFEELDTNIYQYWKRIK